jgi:hypothetical protein
MDFSFAASTVKAFGWESRSGRQPTPKTYSFFFVDDKVAVARSSGKAGGKTMMHRLRS